MHNLNRRLVGDDRETAIWHRSAFHVMGSRDHDSGYLVLLSAVNTSSAIEIALNALTWIIRHDWRELWSVTSEGM